MRRKALASLLFALAVAAASAQGRMSAITGTIVDGSGGVVREARIRAVHVSTGEVRMSSSNKDGYYRLPLLELGGYKVIVEKDGFKSSQHEGVVLELDREAVVDHVLTVGDLEEEIVVSGQAHTVEATPSALTSLIDSVSIERLPLNGRDYIQLATMQAGAPVARAHVRNVNHGYGLQISISGSRPSQNNFRLDGLSLTSYNGSTPGSINGVNLGVDAIREFSVHSSVHSAEYGRAGGGVVNAATKSGGNDFHGSLFFFHRNDNLDARNFFDGAVAPEFRRHQFGASTGGPILRNRTFFFVNYESLREARGNTTINTTMTAEARRGNLIAGRVAVHPMIARVVDFYPLPNGEILGDTGLFVFANAEAGTEDFATTRLDHNFRESDKLFFRYSIDDGARRKETDLAMGIRSNKTWSQSAVLEEAHIFSSNLVNTARFGFLRTFTIAGKTTTQVAGTDSPDLAFVPGSGVIGVVDVSGLSTFPGGSNAENIDAHTFNSFQLSNDLTWIRGGHSLKAGGYLERIRFNTDSQSRQYGDYRFRSIALFLTNTADRFRAQLPGSDTIRGHRQWVSALYLQDTWKVSRRLTLDIGLRWESASVPVEVNGKVSNLDQLTDRAVRLGDPLFDNPSLKNFHPRVGLAWDVFANGRTIVRGGYGIFPDLLLPHFILTSGVRNPPFFLRGETRRLSVGDFPRGGYDRLVADPIPEVRTHRIPRDLHQPYVQQWNWNVEQTLDRYSSFRISYAGSHGLNLSSIAVDANLVEPIKQADGRLFFPANGVRMNPAWGQIRNRTFDAHSSYHGLQTRFLRRLTAGLQTQFSYSFSKSIDDSSTFNNDNEASNAGHMPLNGSPRFNRGLSGHDVRHYMSVSGTWELPLRVGRGWRRIAGGWQLGGIVTYGSGLPLSAWLDYDAAHTQTSESGPAMGQRPDLAPGVSGSLVTGDPLRWVGTSAFRRPEPGFLGNLGRNTITGPDLANVDFSLVKSTKLAKLGDSAAIDFRVEAFNLLNRTNFDMPAALNMVVFDAVATRPDFGRITSAGSSREIQLGLKLRF